MQILSKTSYELSNLERAMRSTHFDGSLSLLAYYWMQSFENRKKKFWGGSNQFQKLKETKEAFLLEGLTVQHFIT